MTSASRVMRPEVLFIQEGANLKEKHIRAAAVGRPGGLCCVGGRGSVHCVLARL